MHHPTVPEFEQCVSFEAFSNQHQELAYNVTCLFVMYFLPLIIITVSYVCIFWEINTNSKEISGKTFPANTGRIQLRRSDQRPLVRARRRTLRMTVTIVSVFALCWLPYATMTLWYMFDRKSAVLVSGKVQDLFFIMAVSNSCMDPLVYGSYTLDMNIISQSLGKIFRTHGNTCQTNRTSATEQCKGVALKETARPTNNICPQYRRHQSVAFRESSLTAPSATSDRVRSWSDNKDATAKVCEVFTLRDKIYVVEQ